MKNKNKFYQHGNGVNLLVPPPPIPLLNKRLTLRLNAVDLHICDSLTGIKQVVSETMRSQGTVQYRSMPFWKWISTTELWQ